MPFHTTAERAERTVRLLGLEAGVRGVALPDDVLRDAVGCMHGFPGWLEMSRTFGAQPLSPPDDEVDATELSARHARQRKEISELLPDADDVDSIVRDIGASGTPTVASWIDYLNRALDIPCWLDVVEVGGKQWLCLGLGESELYSQPFAFFIESDGRSMRCRIENGAVENVDGARELLRRNLDRDGQRNAPDFQTLGNLLGYDVADPCRHRLIDVRDGDASASASRVAAARAWLESRLPAEAVVAAFRSGAIRGPLVEDLAPDDVIGGRRRAFAAAWPDFVDRARLDRPPTSWPPKDEPPAYVCDGHEDVDEAMIDLVRNSAGCDRAMAERVLDRLRGRRWDTTLADLEVLFGVLGGLRDEIVPRSQEDVEAFIRVCTIMGHSVRSSVNDRVGVLTGIVGSLHRDGWVDDDRRMQQMACEKAFEGGAGIEWDQSVEMRKVELVDKFFKWTDWTISSFMWAVAEPSLALYSEPVRYVLEAGRKGRGAPNIDPNTKEFIIPPTAFENSCTQLFLEGISFDEFVLLSERFLAKAGEERGEPVPVEMEAIAAALDAWRPLLRPQYADIAVEDLARMVLEGLERQGERISELWPGARLQVANMGRADARGMW